MRKERRVSTRLRVALLVGVCVLLVFLVWPVGTWLQSRESWVDLAQQSDAVYLVAGERDQDRRVAALVDYANRAGAPPRVLVGNETSLGLWSHEEQRNLTVGEWGASKIKTAIEDGSEHDTSRPDILLLDGEFLGTDDEMQALGEYLEKEQSIHSLVVVTSPFHVRRTLQRLRLYVGPGMSIAVRPAAGEWRDRAPWTVVAELLKMFRDRLGLTRAPYLSRRGWFRTRRTNQNAPIGPQ